MSRNRQPTNAYKKNPQRQYKGMQSRIQGKRFEDEINDACTYYAKKGNASIHKTPEPMKPVQSLEKGKFIAHFEKKAQPDYKGALKGGRAVMFEAKFTASDKMEQSRVSEEQSAILDQFALMGACCFVMLAFEGKGYYRIPWHVWRNMKSIFGRVHLKPDDLESYKVPCVNGIVLLLDGLED